jgi:hypothetical protein
MGTPKIVNQGRTTMYVDDATERKTAKVEQRSFGAVMGMTANIALRGVEVGATVVGGPLVGAAVRGVTGPLSSAVAGQAGLGGQAGDEQSTLDQVKAMQAQAQDFNLQFLALQEEVQMENRRFTTVSNVLKAKHETAKAAVQNIRA